VVDAAARQQPPDPETARRIEAAKAAKAAGDHELATNLAVRAITAGEVNGDARGQSAALRELADLLSQAGRFEEAISTCERSLEILTVLGDEAELCRALTTRSFALNELGLCEEALAGLATASEIADRLHDSTLQYWVQNRVGGVHGALGKYGDARVQLTGALTLAESLTNETRFAALNNLTDSSMWLIQELAARGESDPAGSLVTETTGYATRALELARALGHPYKVAIALSNFGVMRWLAGDPHDALRSLAEAQRLAHERGYYSLELSTLQYTAPILLSQGETYRAIDLLEHVLDRARAMGERPIERDCLIRLTDAYELVENYRGALSRHREFYALEQTIRSERTEVRARILAHRMELDNARFEAADARAKSAVTRAHNRRLEEDKLSLQVRTEELERHAHQDALTGLGNRRFLNAVLPRLFHASAALGPGPGARGPGLSLAMVDFDHFKAVNDAFGHAVGDTVLQRVAQLFMVDSRVEDLVARFGGEEFLLGFTNTDHEAALTMCERLRQSIAAEPWSSIRAGLAVTVSIGIATRGDTTDVGQLIQRADEQLCLAKAGGRNCIRQYQASSG
jgi:diguanylate cyclase (GGDEF)-like protein